MDSTAGTIQTEVEFMKIMVVGGAGYVGQRLCPELIARGHDVTAVDAMLLGNPIPAYKLIWDDLFNLKVGDLEGFDRVIFLAGLSNDPMANFSPGKNFIQNTAAPAYLAYIAKEAKVKRFIYASSASVYGQCFGIMDETAIIRPAYPYGLSKLAGERAAMQMADADFQVISLRKGTICGYSPRMRFDLAINAMYKDAVTKGRVVVNNGRVHRPILSMADAVEAYVRSVETDVYTSAVFNVCSFNSDMEAVGRSVSQRVGSELFVHYEPEMRDYRISGAAARICLGFEPKQSINDILYELEFNCPPSIGDFDADCHYNIRMFRKQK